MRIREGILLVPKGGLEPPHPCGHMTLNQAQKQPETYPPHFP